MKLLKSMAFAFAAISITWGANAQIPVEDLGRYPAMSSLDMSPDGKFLVGLMTPPGNDGTDRGVAVWDLTKPGSAPTFTPSNDKMKFIGASAFKAGKILVRANQAWTGAMYGCIEGKSTGATKTFIQKTYMTDIKMKKFDEPFEPVKTGNGILETCAKVSDVGGIVADLPLDDTRVVVSRVSKEWEFTEYLVYDLKKDSYKLIFRENATDSLGLIDTRTGELLTKQRLDNLADGEYYFTTLIVNDAGEFEEHSQLTWTSSKRNTIDVVGKDETSGKYYVVTDQFSDKSALYMYDAKAKKFDDQPLFAHPDFSVTGISLGRKPNNFNKLLAVFYDAADEEVYYVDEDLYAIHEGLKSAFPGKTITIREYTEDFSKVLFITGSTVDTATYYLLRDRKVPELIGASRPWILPQDIGPTELVYYNARDGMKIPAFLAKPPGWKNGDGPVPTVIMPHGGPWARDYAQSSGGGDTWVHFFTSRGYAVLKPQYRGSRGWGHSLWLAGDNEWGQKMQDDKDDGAAWLVQEGIADPNKLVMMGYSYGGFAAFAATVRENSPYQCAIAGAGVANLERVGALWSDDRIQRAIQGHTVTGMDPIENTDKANIPILIFHGDRDVRVPLFHSTDFYNKVKDKVDAELVVVKDMPHSNPWWPENFNTSFNAIDDFLDNRCFSN